MPAQVSSVWWSQVRKDHTGKLPFPDLKKFIGKYEDSLEELERDIAQQAKSGAELEADRKKVAVNFKLVKEAISEAREACDEDEQWEELGKALVIGTKIKKDEATLKKIQRDVVIAWKREKAMNEAEAEYETVWHGFEELREDRTSAPSLDLFGAMDDQCRLLKGLAEQCQETPALNKKYNTQIKIIEKEIQQTQNARQTYQRAIDDAIKLRKDLLVDMKAAGDTIGDLHARLETLVEQMTTYAEESNLLKCSETLDLIIKAGEAADKAFQDGSEPFAPGTTTRSSLDIKAAKLHADDTTKLITKHFTALINQNKANFNKNKDAQELVKLGKDLMPARRRR